MASATRTPHSASPGQRDRVLIAFLLQPAPHLSHSSARCRDCRRKPTTSVPLAQQAIVDRTIRVAHGRQLTSFRTRLEAAGQSVSVWLFDRTPLQPKKACRAQDRRASQYRLQAKSGSHRMARATHSSPQSRPQRCASARAALMRPEYVRPRYVCHIGLAATRTPPPQGRQVNRPKKEGCKLRPSNSNTFAGFASSALPRPLRPEPALRDRCCPGTQTQSPLQAQGTGRCRP